LIPDECDKEMLMPDDDDDDDDDAMRYDERTQGENRDLQ